LNKRVAQIESGQAQWLDEKRELNHRIASLGAENAQLKAQLLQVQALLAQSKMGVALPFDSCSVTDPLGSLDGREEQELEEY
jgi:uncharacterized small protein (DUF1192 family)